MGVTTQGGRVPAAISGRFMALQPKLEALSAAVGDHSLSTVQYVGMLTAWIEQDKRLLSALQRHPRYADTKVSVVATRLDSMIKERQETLALDVEHAAQPEHAP